MDKIRIIWFLVALVRVSQAEDGPPAGCGSLPSVPNAVPMEDPGDPPYPIGTSVSLSCSFGYVSDIKPRETLICQQYDNGAYYWSIPDFQCKLLSCGDPGSVVHGRRIGSVFTFGSKVEFTCNEGYHLIGKPERFCQTDSEWSGHLPECQPITCSRPPALENGRPVYTSTSYGAILTYECNPGTKLVGSKEQRCGSNGIWIGDVPTCTNVSCPPLGSPKHGFVTFTSETLAVGSLAIYACPPGTKMLGESVLRCLESGFWNYIPPACKHNCLVKKLNNGDIGKMVAKKVWSGWRYVRQQVFDKLPVGTEVAPEEGVLLRCKSGFEPYHEFGKLTQEIRLICQNGDWSPADSCDPARCYDAPPRAWNVFPEIGNISHGSIVSYVCKENYEMIKIGRVVCANGVWGGTLPVCKDTRCKLEDVKGFEGLEPLQTRKYTQNGGKLGFRCISGYETSGYDVTCRDGEWRAARPPCQEASCDRESLRTLEGIDFDSIRDGKTPHGSTAAVRCVEGFRVVDSITCQRGNWKGTASPSPCQANDCVVVTVVRGSIMIEVPLVYGQPSYMKASIGSTVKSGNWLHLFCDEFFHHPQLGKVNRIKIVCTKGKWMPLPKCPGQQEFRSTTNLPAKDQPSNTIPPVQVMHGTTKKPSHSGNEEREDIVPTMILMSATAGELLPNDTENGLQACSLNMTVPQLSAYYRGNRVISGYFVHDSQLQFQCEPLGKFRLSGSNASICQNGQWLPPISGFCRHRTGRDVIIDVIPNDANVLQVALGRTLLLSPGIRFTFYCYSPEAWSWPQWKTNSVKPLRPDDRSWYDADSRRNRYFQVFNIFDASSPFSGTYSCSTSADEYSLSIIIRECPPVVETDGLVVEYPTKPYKVARFSCTAGRKLIGSPSVQCNFGNWSSVPPVCEDPPCLVGNVYDVLPQGIVMISEVAEETVPPGTQLHLGCDDAHNIIQGARFATCGKGSQWQVGEVKCIQGCIPPALPENSTLVLHELKESYVFGESLILSCPTGQKLSVDLERIVCMFGGWSETTLPECI